MRQIDFFSCCQSFISFKNKNNCLIMHTKHGSSKVTRHSEVMSLALNDADQKTVLSFPVSRITSSSKQLLVTFSDRKTVICQVRGEKAEVTLDINPLSKFDYILSTGKAAVINSYATLTKYQVFSDDARIEIEQNYEGDLYRNPGKLISRIRITSAKKVFTFCIQEIEHNIEKPVRPTADFYQSAENFKGEFQAFIKDLKVPRKSWSNDVTYAGYVLWSSTIGKAGLQKRDLIVASNEMMNCVWAFDSGFPAYGLAKAQPRQALNQILAFYDFKDDLGCVPGSMDDCSLRWNFLKPPGQGMFLKSIIREYRPDDETLEYLYQGLKRQLAFWRNEKDLNGDGICEYHHGNESCLDNATVFDEGYPVDSCDLTAYLVETIDCLEIIAGMTGRQKEADNWRQEGDELAKKAVSYFVEEGIPYVRKSLTGEKVISDSIIPYTLLQLRNRLPGELREKWVKVIREEFLSRYGLASEKLNSDKFEEDGYFRGSVFHYYTVPLADALRDIGEEELAVAIARGYCRAFLKSGSAECFNSIDGSGQHVTSFTSAAGTFLYFCQNYL